MEVGWVGIAGCLEVRGFGEARRLRGSRGCLFLRGNISKARRKSCQINFSPFQSHPWEFLPHFTSADLTTPLFWMELLLSLSFSFRWGRLFTVVTPHTPSSPCIFSPLYWSLYMKTRPKWSPTHPWRLCYTSADVTVVFYCAFSPLEHNRCTWWLKCSGWPCVCRWWGRAANTANTPNPF